MTDLRGGVAALMRGLAGSMKALADAEQMANYVAPSINPIASLEDKYRGKPPPMLSAELRAKLGLPPP